MRWRSRGQVLGLLVGWVAGGCLASVRAEDVRTYQIDMDGAPIGQERYQFTGDGHQTHVILDVESTTKVMFLTFHYKHHRDELWDDGQLQRLTADTDDNGSLHHITAERHDQHWQVIGDGKPLTVPDAAGPLSMWNRSLLEHPVLFSVEQPDDPAAVTVTDLGADSVIVDGAPVSAEHFSLAGGVHREVWFDADGELVKFSFHRMGFAIDVIRSGAAGAPKTE